MDKEPRYREVAPGIWRSPLPLAREVAAFSAMGGRTLIDLTQRARPTIERACLRTGVLYVKWPLPYEGGDIAAAAAAVISATRPVLFHCFHGRDRTGAVAELVLERLAPRC